jgi:hypothetical protein
MVVECLLIGRLILACDQIPSPKLPMSLWQSGFSSDHLLRLAGRNSSKVTHRLIAIAEPRGWTEKNPRFITL